MKKFIKRMGKAMLMLFLLAGIILFFGVIIPEETYRQKDEEIPALMITNANIVDVHQGKIISGKQVLLQNNRIVAIDSVMDHLPAGCKTLDARGQYIMPSLWDMHVHTLSLSPQLHFPLLIANGVTGIRDVGDGDSWISDIDDVSERDKSRWEKQASSDGLLMPKILQATSYHVEEIESIRMDNYQQKVSELVTKLKLRGEPFVKVQLEKSDIPSEIFYALQQEARKQGIPVLGHLPPHVDVQQVLDNGFLSIEHAWALVPHMVSNRKTFERDLQQKEYDLAHQDSALAKAVLQKMVSTSTYYVPTHVSSNKKEVDAFDEALQNNPHNEYIESVQLFFWKALNWLHTQGYDRETDLPVLKNYYERGLAITGLAQQNGVTILAGTDALDRNVYHGFSIHDELQEMVKAGLTTHEALKTATIHPAQYFRRSDEYGSITVGQTADFVLLEKNPLEDISHTKTIRAVFYNNRLYDSDDLEEMKSFVKRQASSFGVSCQFIWNMIKRS